jgi:hypothetical protein
MKTLSYYILFGVPLSVIFWMILAVLGIEKRKIFLFVVTYMCVFIALPLVLYPLVEVYMKK